MDSQCLVDYPYGIKIWLEEERCKDGNPIMIESLLTIVEAVGLLPPFGGEDFLTAIMKHDERV